MESEELNDVHHLVAMTVLGSPPPEFFKRSKRLPLLNEPRSAPGGKMCNDTKTANERATF